MKTASALTRLLVATFVVVATAACTHPGGGPGGPHPTRPPATTAPPGGPGQVLVDYTASGGMCPESECGVKVTIYRSGAWHGSVGAREMDGQLDPGTTRQLVDRVERQAGSLADLPPGPELCPAAYDGSAITITVHAGGRPVTVTNCDWENPKNNVEIPGENPLLRHLTRLVGSLVADEPTPGRSLVEWHESGGHCVELCPIVTATISADGSWVATRGPVSASGHLDEATLAQLNRRIEAGARALPGLPPADICPSAYDGRDIEVTYHVGGRAVSVSNCERDFGDNELILYTADLIHGLL